MQSADTITLIVHFRMKQSAKKEFIAKLQDVFAQIRALIALWGRGAGMVEVASRRAIREPSDHSGSSAPHVKKAK
jgi:hypothetical protein